MYKRNFILVLSLASLLVGNSYAQDAQTNEAARADRAASTLPLQSTISNDFSLPVTLDSRSQALDGKNRTSIFMDNVVIRQGSLELLADRVEVNAVDGAGRETISASGKPASYKQRKDDGTMVEARANEIIYNVASRTISLKGAALIMQNEVRVNGDMIVFDMAKEQILASTNENSTDSVRTVISPGAFTIDPSKQPDEDKN